MACLNIQKSYVRSGPMKGKPIKYACRQCKACRLVRQSTLEFACLMAQLGAYKKGLGCTFGALTYSDAHVPLVPLSDVKTHKRIDPVTLRKADFSKFWHSFRDRLRYNNINTENVSYIGCGEYGDETSRPHYHFILFGIDKDSAAPFIRASWRKGICSAGVLRAGGIRYVVDYILKQQTGKAAVELYDKKGIERPFLRHSTKLGNDFFFDSFNFDDSEYTYCRSGKNIPIPSFFRHKIDHSRLYGYLPLEDMECAKKKNLPLEVYQAFKTLQNCEEDIRRSRSKGSPAFDVDYHLKQAIMSAYYGGSDSKFITDMAFDALEEI